MPHDIPIISQKNAHDHSKEAQSKNFTSTNKKFRAHVVRVVLMLQRAGVRPGASGCRRIHQVFGDVPGLECALCAFWRAMPARRVGIGFHWACRLITCALMPTRPPIEPESQGGHRVRTWRGQCV